MDTLNNLTAVLNERCDILQPILNKKIEIGEKISKAYEASESDKVLGGYYIDYLNQVDLTIKFSDPWLIRVKKEMDGPGFKFFLDKRIQDKTYALIDKFNADYTANIAIMNFYTNPTKDTAGELMKSVNNIDNKQEALEQKIKAAENYSDIRGTILKINEPKCDFFKKSSPVIPAINKDKTG